MVRRFEDPVEVRAKAGPGSVEGEVPDSFLWRGRLYVVRSVLGHWRERRAWWNESAARAVHGETRRAASVESPGSEAGGFEAGGFEAERQVWRVEASAGRRAGTGVYDLCRGPVSTWSLLRVAD
jgi:hypothetical protein